MNCLSIDIDGKRGEKVTSLELHKNSIYIYIICVRTKYNSELVAKVWKHIWNYSVNHESITFELFDDIHSMADMCQVHFMQYKFTCKRNIKSKVKILRVVIMTTRTAIHKHCLSKLIRRRIEYSKKRWASCLMCYSRDHLLGQPRCHSGQWNATSTRHDTTTKNLFSCGRKLYTQGITQIIISDEYRFLMT